MAGRFQSVSIKYLKTSYGCSRVRSIRLCTAWKARRWIKAEWRISENNRRARYYEITRAGRKQLERRSRGTFEITTSLRLDGNRRLKSGKTVLSQASLESAFEEEA